VRASHRAIPRGFDEHARIETPREPIVDASSRTRVTEANAAPPRSGDRAPEVLAAAPPGLWPALPDEPADPADARWPALPVDDATTAEDPSLDEPVRGDDPARIARLRSEQQGARWNARRF
jgi:hypothetical protein